MNVKQKKTMMWLVNLTLLSGFCINAVASTNIEGRKLFLKPIKFVDLKMHEHQTPETPLIIRERQKTDEELGRQFQDVTKRMTINYSEDNLGATTRKVWSRWSKWGECSATCGQGTKTRRRLCLTGRCAPGEREEQRLPCCRQPCELD